MGTTLMSMTGFGAATFTPEADPPGSSALWRVEIRAVNHKGLAVRFHGPPEVAAHEAAVSRLLRERLVRGAVDVTVTPSGGGTAACAVTVDRASLGAVMQALSDVARDLGVPPPSLDAALRLGPFVQVEPRQVDPAALATPLLAAVGEALDGLVAMRAAEAVALAADLSTRLARISDHVEAIAALAPAVLSGLRSRLEARLEEAGEALGLTLDPARAMAEVVVFADRSDLTEELVRARAHLATLRRLLDPGAGSDGAEERGRRLDFMTQELLRELNTMGSKARDAGIAARVVDAKVELEKIREQVQNIA